MAKTASLYRFSKDTGVVQSRYCTKEKRGECKKYAYYKANLCSDGDWNALRSARYVLIPITDL